ncbi:MAG: 4-alpha-glucanotransferase [Clostridia bacterium]|jgi:4-alpha-glucanotransferase|nr:4-alpha-glucanotransferase [Clostridia bacterium]MCI2000660.1 4-alpha-glucanotransferase [Clostridia bacterium]MCI2015267.1 4-alpha-glucanotransferase [Clostridia bacterium]
MEHIRKSGILLSPTSFPSNYGIGDLGKSAYDFIDFLKESGMKYWQILPLNPTGFKDSPYQSFSAFAGNFYLISPDILINEKLISPEDIENINFLDEKVEYGKVIPYKMGIFKKAFKNFKNMAKTDIQFIKFCQDNEFWLNNYALFVSIKDYYIQKRKNEFKSEKQDDFCKITASVLNENTQKDYYYGGVWASWDEELINRNPLALRKMSYLLEEKITFYKFLQFEFFSQWSKLKKYANSNGIEIIGDMPIFVAWDSADTWSNQNLFKLDSNGFPTEVAGVPPDYFSKTGQLWGNPVYRWEEHEKNGYLWWCERIKNTLLLTDKIRIDHFRGFESNYCIPFGSKDATVGKWKKGPQSKLFKVIEEKIGLPFIAEDLGIITKEVEDLRDEFNLPGMRVLQFAFDKSKNNPYLPHNYTKNSVVYTGTHDNDTSIGWYRKATEFEKDFLRRYMNTPANRPSWDLIRLAMSSAADTAIFPLQDVLELGSEARMNTPGTESGNWQWRYKKGDLTEERINELKYLCKIFKR